MQLNKASTSGGSERSGFDQSPASFNASGTLPPIPTEEREAGSGQTEGLCQAKRKGSAALFLA